MEKENLNKKPLITLEKKANGIEFSLGSETRIMTPKEVQETIEFFEEWQEWYENYIHYARYYKDYSIEKIEEGLKEDDLDIEKGDMEEYSIGSNFASFLQLKTKKGIANNHEVSKIIEDDWKKEFPEFSDKLTFDSEHSYCYVYTKDREVAKKFLWWSYIKYKKEKLKDFIV